MGKHTEGPWTIIGESLRDYEGSEIGTGDKIVAVTVTEECGESGEEERANARLIAASPRLLDALEKLVECLEMGKLDSNCTCPEEPCVYCEAKAAIRAAREE